MALTVPFGPSGFFPLLFGQMTVFLPVFDFLTSYNPLNIFFSVSVLPFHDQIILHCMDILHLFIHSSVDRYLG